MKILYSIRGLIGREGGATYVVASLSSRMALRGHQVDILVDELEHEVPDGVGEIFIRSQLDKNGLRGLIRQYDVVHDNGIWLPFNHAVALACYKVGVRRIVSPHGAMMPWIMAQRRWKKQLGWWLYQKRDLHKADLVLSTAPLETDALRKAGYSGKVTEIPLAVDAPGPVAPRTEKSVRQALFLSRIHPKKGIQDLIGAWKKLSPPGWRLVVVGPDELGLRAELETMSNGANIVWLGPLFGEDKLRILQESDLYILPTYSENFGVSVVEAMLMELPVLTTTETPWTSLDKDGIGWVIRPGEDSLLPALESALTTETDELRKMGHAAREWAAGRFTWDVVAQQVEQAYERLRK